MASSLQKLFGVAGRVAVVTGGGRGLGLHIAKTLVENGATVYISSRSAETCKRAAERLSEAGPGVCRALPEDLSSEDGCKRLAAQFAEVESSGKLDILVNNSGVAWGAPFDEFPEKQWDKVMGLNVKTPFLMIRALRPMLERAAAKGSPSRVINIGSITGVLHTSQQGLWGNQWAANQLARRSGHEQRVNRSSAVPPPTPCRRNLS
jgi:NAD(P)-dependent dehydrogenase (short-subunit alcohol dehydrogenase family)